MKRRWLLAIGLVAGSGIGAHAADAPALPLPVFAQAPQARAPQAGAVAPAVSPWTGFYVGTDVFGGVAKAGKSSKGFIGAEALAGYDREFANGAVLGIQASTGYAPFWGPGAAGPFSSLHGYEFGTASVKLGYDMGRVMPYVTAGVIVTKIAGLAQPSYNLSDSTNDLLNGPGKLDVAPRVGAGFDYAVTNNLQVGVGVSVGRSPALVWP